MSRYTFGWWLFLAVQVILIGCQSDKKTSSKQPENVSYTHLKGEAMGTTYSIIYSSEVNYQYALDSILNDINDQLSTYDTASVISHYNRDTSVVIPADAPLHFEKNYQIAKEISAQTDGYFNPTVMPLVEYWGFGAVKKDPPATVNQSELNDLLKLVGFDKTTFWVDKNGAKHFGKTNPNVRIDFNAIAPGYAVDVLGDYLAEQGIKNYMVEIGGEVVGKGVNEKGEGWRIGIHTPSSDASLTDFQTIMKLENRGLATSGNYRKFIESGGKRYVHTINPRTGRAEPSDVLSASVFAKDAMTADAFATAFMAMGLEKAFKLAESLENIEVYFIYTDSLGKTQTKYTEGISKIIIK